MGNIKYNINTPYIYWKGKEGTEGVIELYYFDSEKDCYSVFCSDINLLNTLVAYGHAFDDVCLKIAKEDFSIWAQKVEHLDVAKLRGTKGLSVISALKEKIAKDYDELMEKFYNMPQEELVEEYLTEVAFYKELKRTIYGDFVDYVKIQVMNGTLRAEQMLEIANCKHNVIKLLWEDNPYEFECYNWFTGNEMISILCDFWGF